MESPLTEQLRPTKLSDFVGQDRVSGPLGFVTTLLQKSKTSDFFPSLLFWGPPGCGKTTLARIIASELERPFYEFSAVNTSVKEIEKIVFSFSSHTGQQASFLPTKVPVLFLDEIHRFNKAQQDTLLPHVEKGSIILLGATTENPSFSINNALLSRCRVIVLEQLKNSELERLVNSAMTKLGLQIAKEAQAFLLSAANGDARILLNTIEIASHLATNSTISVTDLEQAVQKRHIAFDLKGDEYYNTISALHKSIRGSDPNASLYWLARMVEAGQDPLYIARRLIRMASEDIGMADHYALVMANAALDTCKHLGIPECKLALAQVVVYLAKASKSNKLYTAYQQAAQDVHSHGNLPVPLHIRNASTTLMKELGYGKDYDYSHSAAGEKSESVCYLPEELSTRTYLSETSSA